MGKNTNIKYWIDATLPSTLNDYVNAAEIFDPAIIQDSPDKISLNIHVDINDINDPAIDKSDFLVLKPILSLASSLSNPTLTSESSSDYIDDDTLTDSSSNRHLYIKKGKPLL